MMQLDIFTIHKKESPKENETILQQQKSRLSEKCKILFNEFMTGAIINSNNSPVGDFRRRRQDLTDENGFHISLHSNGQGGIKNWWMDEKDKAFNRVLLKTLSENKK